MKVAVIISKCAADLNIAGSLGFGGAGWKNIFLHFVDAESPFCENIDREVDADLFVFATKHQSASGRASLTCHCPGNWGKAEFGGVDKRLCSAPAFYLRSFFLELKKYEGVVGAEISLEATHHGPFLEKPCMFVEIGSSPGEWNSPEYGRIMAECIKKVFSEEPERAVPCFLIGGNHYSQAGSRAMEKYAVAHICPKYALEFLDERMVMQAMDRAFPKAELVLLDWKGLGGMKQSVLAILAKLGLKYEKV